MDYTTPTPKIVFPHTVTMGDYHEINSIERELNRLFREQIKSVEVGFFDRGGAYIALFYIEGNSYSLDDIKTILENQGWDKRDIEDIHFYVAQVPHTNTVAA